jgi:cytochrome c biogenesis protein CcmG, thiol:disulfide interchange protein DsbE
MSPQSRRRIPVLGVAVGVVVLLAVLAMVLSRGSSPKKNDGDVANLTVTGVRLPLLGEGEDPAAGKIAPTATGVDFGGHRRSIAANGKPKVVNFLAHWCPHCQREVVALTDYREMGKSLPSGLEFISVSTFVEEARGNFPPSTWLEGAKWPFPVLVDDEQSSLARAYGVSGTPFWAFVDGKGRIVKRASGEMPIDSLISMMTKLKDQS